MAILGISFWSGLRFCWLRVTHRNSHSAQQNGQIAENRADQHHLRRRFVPDSPLKEAVSSEPVSKLPKFPANRGENREFIRFPGLQPPVIFKNRRRIKRLHHGYPNYRTGNFLKHNREFALATDQGGEHRSVRPIARLAARFKAESYHPCRLVSAEFRGFSDKDPSQAAGSTETWRQS